MSRRIINTYAGQEVNYGGLRYRVTDVYSHIAYLKLIDDREDKPPICLNLGDLVIAGIEPSMVSLPPRF